MLFFVSLISMAAVGATAFMGDADPLEEDTESTDTPVPDEDMATEGAPDITDLLKDPEEVDNTDAKAPAEAGTLPGATGSAPEEITGKTTEPSTHREDLAWGVEDGTEQDDTLDGSDRNEFLLGRDGADEIAGQGGTDSLEGGDGNDTLSGGLDDDVLHGQDGDDLQKGDEGDDTLFGHSGDDTLSGGLGDDSLIGGQGDDVADGGDGDDAVHGYHGDDTLSGGLGQDSLFGGEGNDVLQGLSPEGEDDGEADYLNGGAGDDTITAGASDIVSTGDGADIISFSGAFEPGTGIEVMDFEPAEDNLIILYDGAEAEPDIDVEQDGDDPELYRVMADGLTIAEVHSNDTITAEDIALVAQSAG